MAKTFESRSVLYDIIQTPVQTSVTKVKYPCKGFCYMAIQNMNLLLEYYNSRDSRDRF